MDNSRSAPMLLRRLRELARELIRGAVSERRMQAQRIIEAENVIGHRGLNLPACFIDSLTDGFHLQAVEETLGHRVVPAVALATHALHAAQTDEQPAKGVGGVLAAAVGMEHQALGRFVPPVGHHERVAHELGTHVAGLGEADYLARA